MEKDYIRRKELYETLERISAEGYVDQERLVRAVGLYPAIKNGSFHDSTARRCLSNDIQVINYDPRFPRIILSSPGTKGVKLATKEEALEYIRRQKIPCFKKLKRLSALEDKLIRCGQIDLEGNVYGI